MSEGRRRLCRLPFFFTLENLRGIAHIVFVNPPHRHSVHRLAAMAMLMVCMGLHGPVFAADGPPQCGLRANPQPIPTLDETGGKHMPARGTVRVLVVFASFSDDETPHTFWPAHQPPLFMRTFIDPDTLTRSSEPFNLTHYFREMSLGQFTLIGDVLWVESARSQVEYSNGSFGRANTDIIKERLDSLVDFSVYDHWTRLGDYSTTNAPDGVVDMIVMVWRTTLYGMLGEASLGYKPAIPVDGKLIEMGFPESFVVSRGSGVTCEYPYGDDPQRVMRTMVHELGHWLLGGLHPYSTQLAGKHQYWGMLCAGERLSSCANAYERERLGWITVPDIDADRDIALGDFVRTGTALKHHPLNGDPQEYFYIENHQLLSIFDDVTRNPDDRGIWILHQQHPYLELDNLRIRPSDGNWQWDNIGVSSVCFSQSLPVFRRGVPRVLTGESHRDQIPTQSSAINWLYVFQGDTGSVRCGSFLGGEAFPGAFDTSTVTVFSPYSNPNSNTWTGQPTTFALEVVSMVDGVATVRSPLNPLDASPAWRFLGIDPTTQGVQQGQLPIAWGSQWGEGQPLEADVTTSILERRSGTAPWQEIYRGPSAQWIDGSWQYGSTGPISVAFRVRVLDSQGKLSRWSNILTSRASLPSGVVTNTVNIPSSVLLDECYPNPFNPGTTIGFRVPGETTGSESTSMDNSPLTIDNRLGSGWVRIAVYDILGREVAELVNERKAAGHYTVHFDGSGLASGVYLCRLHSGGYVETRTLLLLR
jgi:M6 family metalloprotease-like protein